MENQQFFFAVDLGATSGRTIVGHIEEGQLIQEEVTRFPNNLIEQGGHYYWDIYRHRCIILCVGQGNWEEDLLASTRRMDALLREKNVPAWVDYWGYDVAHDWDWWQKQLAYFMQHIINE